MSKGLEEINNPIESEVSLTLKYRKYTYTDKQVDIIEKDLKEKEIKLSLISEILVDISKGNYSDLKDAIKEIREVLS